MGECTGKKKKKRSIDDSPLEYVKQVDIAPSSAESDHDSTEDDGVQSSRVGRQGGFFLFPQGTYVSIVTETSTATSYVTAVTSTAIVGCTVSGSDMQVCNDTLGMADPWFEFTLASTTAASGKKRRRRSADGEEVWEWDYEGEEEDD